MIRKTLRIPFWLISGIIKFLTALIGTILSLGFWIFRFVVTRLFGVFFGALIGFFLGQNHLKVRFFTGKKR